VCDFLPGVKKAKLPYKKYREEIARDADILLWEPTSFYGRVIATATNGPFSHCSAAIWIEKRLCDVGFEEKCGPKMSLLSDRVRKHPGKISVFRAPQSPRVDFVRALLIDNLRGDYNWSGIRALAWCHLLGLRWLIRSPQYRRWIHSLSVQSAGAFCSQHVARCFAQGAGITFVRRENAEISPNDIGLSSATEYLGTLE
jgi:hypothetical protein